MADKRYDVSQKTFEDLANRLQQFSAQLPADEKTMLSAIMIFAARELASSRENEYSRKNKRGVQTDSFTNLQKGFLEAFSRFAPAAFPRPPAPVSDELAKVTVCIE